MTEPVFETVALIGLGLIGSSIAWAIRRDGVATHIVGHARKQETRDRALELGFLDRAHDTAAEAVKNADLVILCSPLGAYRSIAQAIGPHLKSGAIVSDVGSCKSSVFDDLSPFIPEGVHLIPGHPVAGTENSGPDAGFATLFDNRFCIITPPDDVDPDALKKLETFWNRCGSDVEIMDADHHDRVLAITSHLPHLIAYTIVGTAADLENQLMREQVGDDAIVATSDVIRFSAGGFRDFTRIAGSDPVMWRDVFLKNREAVLEMLGRLTEDMVALQRAIRWGEADVLEEWFTRTRTIRRGIIEAGQAGTFAATEPQAPNTHPTPNMHTPNESEKETKG